MVENPRSARSKNFRWSASSEDAVAVDYPIKCNDKCCRSCAAGMIADSVAICCCPCSVVSFLALALVKAPLMIARRCLGFCKNERNNNKKKIRICERSGSNSTEDMNGVSRVEEGPSEIVEIEDDDGESEEGKQKENLSAERIWLELHQLGHLGFGRVSSFTGVIPSIPKGN